MKKKMNFRKSLFIGMAVCSSMIFTNNFEVMADNSTNYKDMSEYAKYEGVIADTQASLGPTPLMQATVALYDIDQDGTKELIVSYGTCLADWTNDIYTLQDGKYVSMIGTVGSQGMFYSAPDGNGMYFLYGFQGYQEISRITKSGMNLEKTLLELRQLGQNENYSTFDNEIKLLAPSDIPAGTSSYEVKVTAPDGGVNMRSGAGVENPKVLPDMIPNGTFLTVTQEATASNGNKWGYTTYNGVSGWIALTQVTKYQEPLFQKR